MAKKFDSVLSALEAVHSNSEKTNQILTAQMKLDKDQEDRARRDKIAADQKDKPKPMASIAKGIGLGGAANKAKSGIFDFAKLTAGLAGISLLMQNIDAIKNALGEFLEAVKGSVQTLRGLGIAKMASDVKKASKRSPGARKGDAGLDEARRIKAQQNANVLADLEAQADAESAKARQAKLNSKISTRTPTLTMDDITYDEKLDRYRNKQYGGFVKKDTVEQLKLAQETKISRPKIVTQAPRPLPVPDVDINDPRKAPSARGKSGFRSNTGKVLNAIPGSGLVRGVGKVAGPVGTAFSIKAGLQNPDLQAAGYGDVSRAVQQMAMDLVDLGDGILNVGTAIKSTISGDGPTLENNIDMSGAVQSYLTRPDVAAGFQTGMGAIPGLGKLMNADLGLKKSMDLIDVKVDKIIADGEQARNNDMGSAIVHLQKQFSKTHDLAMRDGSINTEEHVALRMLVTQMEMAISQMSASQAQNVINTVNNTTLPPSYQLQIETADLN